MMKDTAIFTTIAALALVASGCAGLEGKPPPDPARDPYVVFPTPGKDFVTDRSPSTKKKWQNAPPIVTFFPEEPAQTGTMGQAVDDPDYQEYLDWKRWQEFKKYQEWKANQPGGSSAAQ